MELRKDSIIHAIFDVNKDYLKRPNMKQEGEVDISLVMIHSDDTMVSKGENEQLFGEYNYWFRGMKYILACGCFNNMIESLVSLFNNKYVTSASSFNSDHHEIGKCNLYAKPTKRNYNITNKAYECYHLVTHIYDVININGLYESYMDVNKFNEIQLLILSNSANLDIITYKSGNNLTNNYGDLLNVHYKEAGYMYDATITNESENNGSRIEIVLIALDSSENDIGTEDLAHGYFNNTIESLVSLVDGDNNYFTLVRRYDSRVSKKENDETKVYTSELLSRNITDSWYYMTRLFYLYVCVAESVRILIRICLILHICRGIISEIGLITYRFGNIFRWLLVSLVLVVLVLSYIVSLLFLILHALIKQTRNVRTLLSEYYTEYLELVIVRYDSYEMVNKDEREGKCDLTINYINISCINSDCSGNVSNAFRNETDDAVGLGDLVVDEILIADDSLKQSQSVGSSNQFSDILRNVAELEEFDGIIHLLNQISNYDEGNNKRIIREELLMLNLGTITPVLTFVSVVFYAFIVMLLFKGAIQVALFTSLSRVKSGIIGMFDALESTRELNASSSLDIIINIEDMRKGKSNVEVNIVYCGVNVVESKNNSKLYLNGVFWDKDSYDFDITVLNANKYGLQLLYEQCEILLYKDYTIEYSISEDGQILADNVEQSSIMSEFFMPQVRKKSRCGYGKRMDEQIRMCEKSLNGKREINLLEVVLDKHMILVGKQISALLCTIIDMLYLWVWYRI